MIQYLFALSRASKFDEISEGIRQISERVDSIYKNISMAHFESAEQALRAAANSTSPDVYLMDAISHLRDAHNIINKANFEKVTRYYMFGLQKSEEFAILPGSRLIGSFTLSIISQKISLIHIELGELANAQEWSIICKDHQRAAVEAAMKYQDVKVGSSIHDDFLKDMQSINSSFVKVYERDGNWLQEFDWYVQELSESGVAYIKDLSRSIVSQVKL